MVPRVGTPPTATRLVLAALLALTLTGCGGASHHHAKLGADASTRSTPASCSATVMATLSRIALHIYREGVRSERTGAARAAVRNSIPLREALEHDDAQAAGTAARALVAGGRLTNLRVERGGRVLTDVGSPGAVTPLRGQILDAGGAPIGTFVTTVWSDEGLIAETNGVTQSSTVLRSGQRTLAGQDLPAGRRLKARGQLQVNGTSYHYTSFGARRFPRGRMRVYLFKPTSAITQLCGATEQDTLVNTLSSMARLIYEGEVGRRTQPQVRRAQHDAALLSAVAQRDPAAARRAIVALLNQHIVRMRVSTGGRLLSDVGGPLVLAPVQAPLRLHGRTIGSVRLSIQDDEGYLRLARRLLGLNVLMYMGSRLVLNSLGPSPGTAPDSGAYSYRGKSFRVYTFTATAFPSGPLRIQALIPIPYS
jgi:hypothetical protein